MNWLMLIKQQANLMMRSAWLKLLIEAPNLAPKLFRAICWPTFLIHPFGH